MESTSIYAFFSCIVQSASQMHDPVVVFFYLSDVHHVLIYQGILLEENHESPEQRWESSVPDDSNL